LLTLALPSACRRLADHRRRRQDCSPTPRFEPFCVQFRQAVRQALRFL
jgi:hypothetical protein